MNILIILILRNNVWCGEYQVDEQTTQIDLQSCTKKVLEPLIRNVNMFYGQI